MNEISEEDLAAWRKIAISQILRSKYLLGELLVSIIAQYIGDPSLGYEVFNEVLVFLLGKYEEEKKILGGEKKKGIDGS